MSFTCLGYPNCVGTNPSLCAAAGKCLAPISIGPEQIVIEITPENRDEMYALFEKMSKEPGTLSFMPTVTVKCGLNPAEVNACLDVLAHQIGRKHNRWVKGAILWIQRAMDHSAEKATDWAEGWPEGAEKPGGMAVAKVVEDRRSADDGDAPR